MYPSPDSDVRHRIAVLFSARTRDAYAAAAAAAAEETYTFLDAWGQPKTWLRGEYAYLAPNAASALLHRFNLKHALLEEGELTNDALDACRAILVPNAEHLTSLTIERLGRWLERVDGRLIVTGKTNLPDDYLGLNRKVPVRPEGYTGWQWLPGSAFGDLRAWDESYVTGYRGYAVLQVEAAAHSRVLAELVEFTGDLSTGQSATKRPIGAGIVMTDRSLYIANQVLEFLGGALQAHLNVEAIRHWANPVHWGDTIGFFLRRLLLDLGPGELWDTRLRSFGAHDGVLSFRHDVHGMEDYSFLDYEIQNLVPASYDIEDPSFSADITPEQARQWVRRTSGHSFIEPALHNDTVEGDPPTAARGTGLYDHVRAAVRNLGISIYTCGRHGGGHLHPETIDAMDYLYAHDHQVLGLCTFCFYHMVEYGVRNPEVVVGGRPLSYATDVHTTIATPGFWFPFHAVVSTASEWRVLRGWDRTHEYDSSYDLVETVFSGRNSHAEHLDDRLENGVYSLQYHPEFANDPSRNNGKGTLDYLRYAINLAERNNLWIANQRQLYQRMSDYQDVAFGVAEGSVVAHNPTDRRIVGLAVERRRAFGSIWDAQEELVHVVNGRVVTLPPLQPGARTTIRFDSRTTAAPRVVQPNHRGLAILDARHNHAANETRLLVSVCRSQHLRLERVAPEARYLIQVDAEPVREVRAQVVYGMKRRLSAQATSGEQPTHFSDDLVFLRVDVDGEQDRFVERAVTIRPGEAEG